RDHAAMTEAGLALAGPKPGEGVLDIGCGSGTTTLKFAARVAPSGEAVGIDISASMLAVARRRAAETPNHVSFIEADATDYGFEAESFDLAFSQFGIMFFADPAASFRNIHGAMKKGGRLVFVCWRGPFENAWSAVPEAAARPFLPPPAPASPDAPGRYSFANPDRVKSILLQSGFHGVEIEKFDTRVHLGNTPEEAASSSIDNGPLLRTLADVDEAIRVKVRAAVTARLAQEMGSGGIYLTAGA